MGTSPDNTLANPEQLMLDLRRQLSECKADAGADEVVLRALDMPSTEQGRINRLERMAREFVEPGARL